MPLAPPTQPQPSSHPDTSRRSSENALLGAPSPQLPVPLVQPKLPGSVEVYRTAFTLSRIHRRSDTNRITAIAIDATALRVFLGLESGYIEEHHLLVPSLGGSANTAPPSGSSRRSSSSSGTGLVSARDGASNAAGGAPTMRLLAGRKTSRSAVLSLACLPHAGRFVALHEDGLVSLSPYDSLVPYILPGVRSGVAVAVDAGQAPSQQVPAHQQQTQHLPTRLAVAVRVMGGKTKLLVYAVVAAPVQQPAQLLAQVLLQEPVSGLAWAGDAVVCQVPGGYKIMQSGSRMVDVGAQLTGPPLAAGVPGTKMGLLLFQDNLLLVTDASGSAVREPLLLPSRPLALASSGLFVVAVLDEAVCVYDRNTSKQVQELFFLHDDPWIAASRRMPVADDATGSLILLATANTVFCLQPVAYEQQARELLKGKRFDQALDLLRMFRGCGEPWALEGLAQAGLLMLQALRFKDAVEALADAGVQAFQPAQLFPLFPQLVPRWLGLVPTRSYWGLAGGLQALEQLVADALELHQATHVSLSHRPEPAQSPVACGSATAGTLEWHLLQAKLSVAGYLLQVRLRAEVMLPDGVDTLAVLLLAETGQAAEVEGLVSQPLHTHDGAEGEAGEGGGGDGGGCAASLEAAVAGLKKAGRWHALALLHAARGQADEALCVWQQLSQGVLQESPSARGAVAAAGGDTAAVASGAAVAVLCGGRGSGSLAAPTHATAGAPATALTRSGVPWRLATPPAEVALAHLPWLLAVAPTTALRVLCGRELPIPGVLALLENRSDDMRWQYLRYLVYTAGVDDAALHTELALELIECIMQHPPDEDADARAVAAATATTTAASTSPAALSPGPGSEAHPSRGLQPATLGPGLVALGSLHRAGSNSSRVRSLLLHPGSFGRGSSSGSGSGNRAERCINLRQVLQAHLEHSQAYDAMIVLQAIQGTPLHLERVQLHRRLGDHDAALHVLALTLQHVPGAIQYCRTYGSSDTWLLLLDLFLRPGGGREPQYGAAVRVLSAEGAALNPLKVLAALPDAMPLHLALDTLAHMSAGTLHRRRQTQIIKSLHRAQNLSVRLEKVALESQVITITDATTCRGCGRLLGTRVFHQYPTGALLCSRCARGPEVDGEEPSDVLGRSGTLDRRQQSTGGDDSEMQSHQHEADEQAVLAG